METRKTKKNKTKKKNEEEEKDQKEEEVEEEEKEEERGGGGRGGGGGGGGGSKRGCYEFSRGFEVLDDKTTSACFRSRIATEPNEEIHFRDDYYNYYDYYYDYYYDDNDDDDDVTKGNGTKKIRGVSRASQKRTKEVYEGDEKEEGDGCVKEM
ncbi:hypothetical protein V1477_010002 [Vespula maculifrons]|uniref:Uncharacterized protein n=1 Tax=Vespula maculifrons TaxID=7453 RepID=A0ABD2CBD1_VESMC